MSLAQEIEDMEARITTAASEIEALGAAIQQLTGIHAADGQKRLAQLQHIQQSRIEMLGLARVFSTMSRDPRKG